ncbi:4-hydroxybenzoate octaprenyltransferase [Algiphilus sp.]|uniref:4-hydroxybenzoate octaprenyltransferase n=1 Tax=Algiphilus sp. TaxID=1872431 RepID=UPI0032EB84C9
MDTLRAYVELMRLHKPVGIWLLLWPVCWSLWMAAEGVPPLHLLLIFVAGTVVMRSAGCVINDIADRRIDPHVARTAQRPLAAGRLRTSEAVRLFAGLCLLALGLVMMTNRATVLLAIPAVLLAASYPFAKRFHHLPQAHLGIAFAWGIPMAQTAVTGTVDWRLCALLMAASVCWTLTYDTYYAMADREEDLRIGVRSSAILFGRWDRLITAALQALSVLLLAVVGVYAGLHWPFALGLMAASVVAIRAQWLIREREASRCLQAFLESHYFGLLVLIGLVADYALHAI